MDPITRLEERMKEKKKYKTQKEREETEKGEERNFRENKEIRILDLGMMECKNKIISLANLPPRTLFGIVKRKIPSKMIFSKVFQIKKIIFFLQLIR